MGRVWCLRRLGATPILSRANWKASEERENGIFIPGVSNASSFPVGFQAEVMYDEQVLTPRDIVRSITGLGYKSTHEGTVAPKSGRRGGSRYEESSILEVEVTGMSHTSCREKVNSAWTQSCISSGDNLVRPPL